MNADIKDDKPLLIIEIGLPLVDVKAGAKGDARPGRLPDGAGCENLLHALHCRCKAEVLVNCKPRSMLFCRLDDGNALLPIWCERLLHDGGNPEAGSQSRELAMSVHACRDIDQIRLHCFKHP